MLNANNLSVFFGGRKLFDSATFVIGDNDRIGLVGKNGAGKTTLLKILHSELIPDSGDIVKSKDYTIGYLPQEMKFNSDNIIYKEAEKAFSEALEIKMLMDKVAEELAKRTDYEADSYLAETQKISELSYRFESLGGGAIQGEIESVLTGLGFERSDFTRKMAEFSGGWQMRVELAKILLKKPKLIMLDEPTNHLDIESISWLEDFLKNYRGAVLVISHDRAFLDNITNRTIEISSSKIYSFDAKYSDYVEIRAEQRKNLEHAYQNQQKQLAQTQKFIDRFRFKATLATRVQSKIKLMEKIQRIELEDEDLSEIDFTFPSAQRCGAIAFDIKNLSKRYDSKLVLDKINLTISRGENIAFVGRNGEGKSTLSKILAGIETYEGEIIKGYNAQIGYYAQNVADELDPNDTPFDVLDKIASGDIRARVRSILGAFLFRGDDIYKKVKILSGGEKSRLALARLLLTPSNILILDEPTNHLDMRSKDILKSALLEYEGALIIVSHDREFLDGLADKTIEFKNRGIKEYLGGLDFFLEKKKIENIQELEKKEKSRITEFKEQKSKADREQKKAIERDKRKAQREIDNIESKIFKLENEASAIETKMSSPEFYNDPKEANQITIAYNKMQLELKQAMEEWEEMHRRLEEI